MYNKAIETTEIGFHKVPILANVEAGFYKVNIRDTNISGAILQHHYILVEPACEDDIQIKWLSKEGFYKFGTFGRFFNKSTQANDGLIVDKSMTSFLLEQSRDRVITKDRTDSLSLYKQQVSTQIVEYYRDLLGSPLVYANLGVYDWIEVKVNGSFSINTKKNFHNLQVELMLPESYCQEL